MFRRAWLAVALLSACAKEPTDTADTDTDVVVVGRTGPKSGDGAVAGGPKKGAASVAFPGVGTMPAATTPPVTGPREPGELAPQPAGRKAEARAVVTGQTYQRFFLTLDTADQLALSEPVTLDGVLASQPFPIGTLLVVASASDEPIALASFRDGRVSHAVRQDASQGHGEVEVPRITLPVSVPSMPTELSVYAFPPDAVPWSTPLTLESLPTLLAGATLIGTESYKP